MKKYVKILSLISALLIAVLCSGCGKKSMTAEEGKLIMATNAEFPPYEYYEGDKVVGIDAEESGLNLEFIKPDHSLFPDTEVCRKCDFRCEDSVFHSCIRLSAVFDAGKKIA